MPPFFQRLSQPLDSALAEMLSGLLARHIAKHKDAGIVIVELRTLAQGERHFLVWSSEDLIEIFRQWPDIAVVSNTLEADYREAGHEASFIRWSNNDSFVAPTSEDIEQRLRQRIPEKRRAFLKELSEGRRVQTLAGLATYWHHKRTGFLCAQLAWLDLAESEYQGHSPSDTNREP
jgi:ribonuclease BN (tRNA processing enzyme)